MIYPQKINAHKSDKIIKSILIASVIMGCVLILINKLTTPKVPWAALANAGIIYTWLTVIYSIKKNTNIAGHVLIQAIAISILIVYIDYALGFKAWSLDIAVPITIIVANITMFILTLISYKKYIKYAIYQLIIVLFSMIPIVFISENILKNNVLSIIAVGISLLNLILTLMLSAKDVKEAVIRKFHM